MCHAPQVSVYIPAYNVQAYIADAVNSILGQAFTDFELIVIDDGSTDGTLAVLKALAATDQRIRLITRPNAGVSATANEAISLARSDLVARIDGDDISLPDRLEKQVAYMRAHPDCVALGSRALMIDEEGMPLYVMPEIAFGHEAIDADLLAGGWPMNQSACIFRKSAVERVGGYRKDLSLHEDHDLLLRLAEIGRLENLPDVLHRYRRHSSSITFRERGTSIKLMTSIMAEAKARRGLSSSSEPYSPPYALGKLGEIERLRLWAWMSLKSDFVPTARKYAWAGFWAAPLSVDSWKLMYCALRGR